jgi:hypothetical protein
MTSRRASETRECSSPPACLLATTRRAAAIWLICQSFLSRRDGWRAGFGATIATSGARERSLAKTPYAVSTTNASALMQL